MKRRSSKSRVLPGKSVVGTSANEKQNGRRCSFLVLTFWKLFLDCVHLATEKSQSLKLIYHPARGRAFRSGLSVQTNMVIFQIVYTLEEQPSDWKRGLKVRTREQSCRKRQFHFQTQNAFRSVSMVCLLSLTFLVCESENNILLLDRAHCQEVSKPNYLNCQFCLYRRK